MIILIIMETFVSNLTVMRVRSQTLSDRDNYLRDSHKTMGGIKNNSPRPVM